MPLQRLDLTQSPNKLAESLGTGLDILSSHKLNQLQRLARASGLEGLGYNSQQANQLSNVSDVLIQTQMNNRARQEAEAMKYSLAHQNQASYAQALQQLLGGTQSQESNPSPQMSQQQFNQLQQAAPDLMLGNGPIKQEVPTQRPQGPPNLSGLTQQQAYQLAQLGLQKKNLERKESLQKELLGKKEGTRLQIQADKETLPYYNKILEEDKTAKKTDIDTNRMVHLINKGKLPDAAYYKLLKDLEENVSPTKGAAAGATAGGAIGFSLGGPPGAALGGLIGGGLGAALNPLITLTRYAQLKENPDAEEFEKLSNGFISGAKALFGSRITDQDLRAFMATVPQLSNTDSGKKSIIRNIQLLNKAAHVRAEVMKKIIKENKGFRPANLPILVEEEAARELDKIANQFVEGVT